jgi:hypothetical protein
MLSLLIWIIWIISFYLVYRNIKRDLFMLSEIALSSIVVVTTLVIKTMSDSMDFGSLLVVAILIVGIGAGAAFWLKKIQKEWQS